MSIWKNSFSKCLPEQLSACLEMLQYASTCVVYMPEHALICHTSYCGMGLRENL